MIKFTRLFIIILLAAFVFKARAQQTTATTSNPYSRYGVGELIPLTLPQNVAMGGLGAAVNNTSGFFNINPVNPASYGALGLTVIDVGIYGNVTSLSQNVSGSNVSQSNGNFRFSHINFAFPITKHSALSFGMQPYSQMGYNYKTSQLLTKNGTSATADTAVNYIYSGNGGLTKAYIGYGFGIGKHLLLGANASYIFGKLQQYSSTEIPSLFGTLNSRVENNYSIGGGSYDLGAQYTIDLEPRKHIILGYSTTLGASLGSQYTYLVSQYDYTGDAENVPLDTVSYTKNAKTKIKMPQTNHFGVTFVNDGKYLIGAEYTSANWSTFSIGGVNQQLQDAKTYNLGGQITPNINALNNYFATVDYRLGFIYDQSYANVTSNNVNTSINSYAITFGLGLPLAPTNTSFYKINFAAELGKRGTLNNGLVKENYINLHLSFTLNDRWFVKYKLE